MDKVDLIKRKERLKNYEKSNNKKKHTAIKHTISCKKKFAHCTN